MHEAYLFCNNNSVPAETTMKNERWGGIPLPDSLSR